MGYPFGSISFTSPLAVPKSATVDVPIAACFDTLPEPLEWLLRFAMKQEPEAAPEEIGGRKSRQRSAFHDMTTVVIFEEACAVHEVQLRDAKASLSAVVDQAVAGKPQVITRHGKREAVIISWAEYERLSKVPSFGRLLMSAPIEPGDIPERIRTPHRPEEF